MNDRIEGFFHAMAFVILVPGLIIAALICDACGFGIKKHLRRRKHE